MSSSQQVRPIAFVAMPFKVKPTGLNTGQGPSQIDFDALWDKAIFPALEALDYLPIRADNQDGSVIIKDMLEQLIYADLVLADISIANGNVYYEAGIRHAVRSKGCVLMSTDWAKPLFDLGQIRQLRYPLNSENPDASDYAQITRALVDAIPSLVESVCPVYALTNLEANEAIESRNLREITHLVSDFQAEIRNCRLASGDEAIATTESLALRYLHKPNTPMYVLRELIELIRDKLGWQELLDSCELLGAAAQKDYFVREQIALAKCKLGHPKNAIAEIEQLIATQGETHERIGLVAGRYKELYRSERNPVEKQRWLGLAVAKYSYGMLLDLNQSYCACNLPSLLRVPGPSFDPIRADHVAIHVLNVCNHAMQIGEKSRWLNITKLTMMFFTENLIGAKQELALVLLEDFASWELDSTITNLTEIVEKISEAYREPFASLLDSLTSRVSIQQETLLTKILPVIQSQQLRFEKFTTIKARLAQPGEIIVSYTADGRETKNTAKSGDYVVENQTSAKEKYIVPEKKFKLRYKLIEALNDTWSVYTPLGEILAIEVNAHILRALRQRSTFYIYAKWGEPQRVKPGDYLVMPLPDCNEIYRVAREEFNQTYRMIQ